MVTQVEIVVISKMKKLLLSSFINSLVLIDVSVVIIVFNEMCLFNSNTST